VFYLILKAAVAVLSALSEPANRNFNTFELATGEPSTLEASPSRKTLFFSDNLEVVVEDLLVFLKTVDSYNFIAGGLLKLVLLA
jgi:hypothetical protein